MCTDRTASGELKEERRRVGKYPEVLASPRPAWSLVAREAGMCERGARTINPTTGLCTLRPAAAYGVLL